MFQLRKLIPSIAKRFTSTTARTPNILEQLKERSLIRISGSEVSDFLQGLITNDIRHLDQELSCMYTMFLNTKGRILHDSIIYRISEPNTFFIECDSQGNEALQKHLKIYRVRRKIDIANITSEFEIFALFNPENLEAPKKLDEGRNYRDLKIFPDPRISRLGTRIIAPVASASRKQISEIFAVQASPVPEMTYRWFRYSLGVGEGYNDLPPNDCFPLECNCDFLHGVSFHKGCYIGQELTARSHHTGVIRKRLMPLFFTKVPTKLPEGNKIVHEGVNLGKLKGVEFNRGLGLIRFGKALDYNAITVGDGVAKTEKPNWWPIEAPKELGLQKL